MPVDPQVQLMLEAMQAAGMPPVSELTPADLRAAMAAGRGEGRYPEPRAATDDRLVPRPTDGDIPVRVYRPAMLPAAVAAVDEAATALRGALHPA